MGNISKEDINRIVYAYHWDPFSILGYHKIKIKNTESSVVRVFHPEANRALLINGSNELEMEKIHELGLFQVAVDHVCFENGIADYQVKFFNYNNEGWIVDDTYRYPPVLTDFDMHLFKEGNHYKIYEKLGAHIITHCGKKGVLFAVWAPNASRVSVIGDFNSWDGRRAQMRVRGSSGIWEIFIPDLTEYSCYKYEIKSKDDRLIVKADPYGFLSELRPKTASVVYDIEKYSWTDSLYMNNRDAGKHRSEPVAVYEVHLASWQRKNGWEYLTYRELAVDLVNYVSEMGYTHLELLPIAEYPFDGSWGYQVSGYYAITSRYGTPEDFAYLVDKCHEKNIGVIVDWVPAHFPKDDFALREFDGSALYEHSDPRLGEHKDWGTLIFNYGRNEVRNFLIANALFLFEKYHIDGLRVDAVASMLYLDYSRNDGEWIPNQYGGNENLDAMFFMRRLNEEVYKSFPGVMMIAEESTAFGGVSQPTYLGGLGFEYKWNMGWMNDFLRYVSKESIHKKYHHNELTFSMIYAFTENFILVLSHDEVVHGKGSLINKMPGDDWQKFANLRASMGFMYGHPGKKLHFMGIEFGQWSEWNFEKSLDWHLLEYEPHKKLQSYFKELNRVYRDNPALYSNDFDSKGFEWINCNDWEQSVVSFVRKSKSGDDKVIVVVNFTPVVRRDYRVGVPAQGYYKEILNSDSEFFGGAGVGNFGGVSSDPHWCDGRPDSISISLPPLSCLMFKLCLK